MTMAPAMENRMRKLGPFQFIALVAAASYALTLAEWQRRFEAAWPKIAELGFDMRFRRMWEYYLAAVQVGFRNGSNMVFQLALSPRIDSVPIVRDFMVPPTSRSE